MANYAKLTITFVGYSTSFLGEDVVIQFRDTTNDVTTVATETYNIIRVKGYFSTALTPAGVAIKFANALLADYGPSGLIDQLPITVTANGADVVVEMTEYNWAFLSEPAVTDFFTSAKVDEVKPPDTLAITSITLDEAASDPLVNIRRVINVVDANYPVTITAPVTKVAANAGELWFDYPRAWTGNVTVVDDLAYTDTRLAMPVLAWYIDEIRLTYQSLTCNAIIYIGTTQTTFAIVSLEYSLDNVTWQPGNVFYGLFTDTYTAYVRDNYGGEASEDFSVTVIPDPEKPEPYFDISKNQSMEFRKLKTFDDDTEIPNQFNALYYQQNMHNRTFLDYTQKWNQSDSVTIQIKTTYSTNTATVIDSEGEDVVSYNFTRKKQYVGLKDSRDCIFKDAGNNQTYVYFTSGKTYDYDTDVENGEYVLNGRLEPWMYDIDAIQNIQITETASMNGQYEVSGYSYDNTERVSVLVIDCPFSDVSANPVGRVKTVYNSEDFDIYEAVVPMAALDGCYHVEIEGEDNDPRYDDQVWIGEPFEVKQVHANHSLIEWSDTKVIEDTDHSTGITHSVRVNGVFYKFSVDGDKETMEDDQGRIVPLKAIKQRKITLETGYIPPYLCDKLTTAFVHDSVTINGLDVQTTELGEIEQVDKNSMQKLTVTMQYNETVTYFDDNSIITTSSGISVLGVTDDQVLGV